MWGRKGRGKREEERCCQSVLKPFYDQLSTDGAHQMMSIYGHCLCPYQPTLALLSPPHTAS
jgi:hypothetical protein